MRVYLAPDAGGFVEPPAGANAEPSSAQPTMGVQQPTAAPLVELDSPRGGRMVRLEGRLRHYLVADAADSSVSIGCEQGAP